MSRLSLSYIISFSIAKLDLNFLFNANWIQFHSESESVGFCLMLTESSSILNPNQLESNAVKLSPAYRAITWNQAEVSLGSKSFLPLIPILHKSTRWVSNSFINIYEFIFWRLSLYVTIKHFHRLFVQKLNLMISKTKRLNVSAKIISLSGFNLWSSLRATLVRHEYEFLFIYLFTIHFSIVITTNLHRITENFIIKRKI